MRFSLQRSGTKFSLRRYGGDVFTQTVRGLNGTGARLSLKRYGGEVFAHTPRGRCFHSLGTGARLSLKRYGGEVCPETVRGRGFHSNGLGGNLRLFMGNSWGMRGDFSLGIRSSEEVQLQAAQIDTHVKSLTKPRFPFYVRTGFKSRKFEQSPAQIPPIGGFKILNGPKSTKIRGFKILSRPTSADYHRNGPNSADLKF